MKQTKQIFLEGENPTLTYFIHCSGVSIFYFEQVNVDLGVFWTEDLKALTLLIPGSMWKNAERFVLVITASKMSKYGVFSDPYFPVLSPVKTSNLDTFYVVDVTYM